MLFIISFDSCPFPPMWKTNFNLDSTSLHLFFVLRVKKRWRVSWIEIIKLIYIHQKRTLQIQFSIGNVDCSNPLDWHLQFATRSLDRQFAIKWQTCSTSKQRHKHDINFFDWFYILKSSNIFSGPRSIRRNNVSHITIIVRLITY